MLHNVMAQRDAERTAPQEACHGPGANHQSIAFDAYGTLFDVYSIGALAEEIFPGDGKALAELWRERQIDYTRLRTLSGQYADFWTVTGDALDFACDRLVLGLTPGNRDRLMAQYERLHAFPENLRVLQELKRLGLALGILSNGTPWMIANAVAAAGMDGLFDHILSVDGVRKFKTAPKLPARTGRLRVPGIGDFVRILQLLGCLRRDMVRSATRPSGSTAPTRAARAAGVRPTAEGPHVE